MARAAPGVVRHGTAKDLADVGVGYTASGASEHSRQAAYSANGKLKSFVKQEPPEWTQPDNRLGDLIAKNAQQLSALFMRLRTEHDEEKRAKVRKNIEIKQKFLEQLHQQRRGDERR